jgi:serine/threonine protein kinase/tetratricopeptide (TPR) repeat protein
MGVVYKARDLLLDRLVALKFLPPDLTRDSEAKHRFIHEAKAASAFDHPNICNVHDFGETNDGQMFIVMACYDGETLTKKIERGSLEVDEAIDIATQVAQGLARAHEHGILHRDIKPANILITSDGVVKIVDFGLAKLTGRSMLTRSGSTVGTAAYMSPEQTGAGEVDQRTDIWSLGVVLYEMLTGRRPFEAEYDTALIYAILNTEPTPLASARPELPVFLQHVVSQCLARNPDQRYQRIGELLVDLSRRNTGVLQTPTVSPPPSSTRRTRTVWYAVITAGVIVLFVVGDVLLRPHDKKPEPGSRLKMIAVLPFENLGPAEEEYFADGLTEEITSRLSAISTLGVISRTSAMQYRRSQKTLPVVASELGVDYVLEGSVRWVTTGARKRLRVTPRLIQVSGDRHLWADNLDRTLDDVFTVQTEIASRVVIALGVVLREREREIGEPIPTRNVDAYQAYLRGRASAGYEESKLNLAIAMFTRAVAIDSTFAQAYAALAACHLRYYWYGYDRSAQRTALASQALDRAFALQPDLPEAYLARGLYYYYGLRDYVRALEAFHEAGLMLPSNVEVLSRIAYIWRRQGKFEAAAEQLKKALTLDPRSAAIAGDIGNTLYRLGRYAEAETYLERDVALLPDQSRTYILKSDMLLRWKGDTRPARRELERVPAAYFPWGNIVQLDIYDRNYTSALHRLAMAPGITFVEQQGITPVPQLRGLIYRYMGDSARSRASFDTARLFLEAEIRKRSDDYRLHMSLGIVYAGLGQRGAAVREAERATTLMPMAVDPIDGAYALVALAQVHTLLGNRDAACEMISFLLELHAPKLLTAPLLRLDPIYDPLRGTRRFEALLSREI